MYHHLNLKASHTYMFHMLTDGEKFLIWLMNLFSIRQRESETHYFFEVLYENDVHVMKTYNYW